MVRICIGQPVRIEQVLLGTPEHGLGQTPLELLFKAVQPAAGAHPAATSLDGQDSPTLLSYAASPLPFGALIGRWFDLYDRFSDVVTLLCAPYYAPFIYSRHRYASTFQAAEALARAVPDTKEKGRQEHRERVEAVVAALKEAQLGEDVTGWAMRVLQSRNDKPAGHQVAGDLLGADLLPPDHPRAAARGPLPPRSRPGRADVGDLHQQLDEAAHGAIAGDQLTAPLAASDPPFRRLARRMLLPAFGVRPVADLEPFTRELCRALLDQTAGNRTFDAAEAYA